MNIKRSEFDRADIVYSVYANLNNNNNNKYNCYYYSLGSLPLIARFLCECSFFAENDKMRYNNNVIAT